LLDVLRVASNAFPTLRTESLIGEKWTLAQRSEFAQSECDITPYSFWSSARRTSTRSDALRQQRHGRMGQRERKTASTGQCTGELPRTPSSLGPSVVVEDHRLGFMQPCRVGQQFISVKSRQRFAFVWLQMLLGGSDEILGRSRIRPVASKQPVAKPIQATTDRQIWRATPATELGRSNVREARLRRCPYSEACLGLRATEDGALPAVADIGSELHLAAAACPLPGEGAADDLVVATAKGARAAGPTSADRPPARAMLASRLALAPTILARAGWPSSVSVATAVGADQTRWPRHGETP
jgi:hypothetical protein